MLDPGDGIQSTIEFEHLSDDIVEVAVDLVNGDCKDSSGEGIVLHGLVIGLLCRGPE